MAGFGYADLALLAGAAFIAAAALVRMMKQRHDQSLADARNELKRRGERPPLKSLKKPGSK